MVIFFIFTSSLLSTRPPHISCNLFCLCLSCSNSLSIHNKVVLSSKRGIFSCKKSLSYRIQNSTKKRINHRSKSLLGKDFLHTWGLCEIRIFKGGGGVFGRYKYSWGCLTVFEGVWRSIHECMQVPKHREYPHRCDCVIPNPFCKWLINWDILLWFWPGYSIQLTS